MSQIDTIPNTIDIGSQEVYPLGVDAAAYITGSATIQNAVASLVDVITSVDTSALGIKSAVVNGNGATVTMWHLPKGKRYNLFVIFTLTDNSVFVTRTIIQVPV